MGDGTARESRIAIAGFGNVLLGDDGFGVEVIKRLQTFPLPVHVEAFDIGIGGMELVLKLMDGFTEMIVVDAVRRGKAPGTLYLFPPSDADLHLRTERAYRPAPGGTHRRHENGVETGYSPGKNCGCWMRARKLCVGAGFESSRQKRR